MKKDPRSAADIIGSLMVEYADYVKACKDCVDLEYGSAEYEDAVDARDIAQCWIGKHREQLKEHHGIDVSRFDYLK